MQLYEDLVEGREKISLVGLGYVGLPIAVAFAKKVNVIGFDISRNKISQFKDGIDTTKEVGESEVKNTKVEFTANADDLKKAKFHIVTVPTPVNPDKTPDFTPLKNASRTLGKNMTKGSIVVFESTVYPGATEEICVPILEEASGMQCGVDFKVGYSPERINPGDKIHRLENIVKVVSGMDQESLDVIKKVYELVVDAGVHPTKSIKAAEAAKVIENSQRDINIAFMNELSIIFNKLDIDTKEVLKAAGTKWNFLNFFPGLVGGHCIGVDPYYLTYKAEQTGYHSQIILSGRKINDDMGRYVTENLIKQMIQADIQIKGSRVAIFGFTFKEDCPDTRNTRVIDIVNELKEYGIEPMIYDPVADRAEAKEVYDITFEDFNNIRDLDALIFAVSHKQFFDYNMDRIDRLFHDKKKKVLIDIKGIYDKQQFKNAGYLYWRL